MIHLYQEILYKPILNLLIFLYNVVPGHDIGIAIIILTVIIKFILYPFGKQMINSQKSLQDIQPKINKLKKEYKDDKEKLAAETMKLYKENKVNPFSSCLPLLIQFPFLIAVYQAFRTGLSSDAYKEHIYSFIATPDKIDAISFGIVDLAVPSLILAVLAGGAQYIQTRMMTTKQPKKKSEGAKDEAMMANMNKSMQYFMPFLTIMIGMQLPAGLTLYWFLTTILTALQQKIIFDKVKNTGPEVIPPKNTKKDNNATKEEKEIPKQIEDKK